MAIRGVKDIDLGFEAITRRIAAADGEMVEVGLLAPEQATIGTHNEFGTRNAPERPFMRRAFDDNVERYATIMADGARKLVDGGTVEGALTKAGIVASSDIKRQITELRDPPNAAATIKAKGSSNPLIDTGAMRNAVAFELTKGGGDAEGGE